MQGIFVTWMGLDIWFIYILKFIIIIQMNCFDLQKFVCTTIRPTQLDYKELYNWEGSAEFVADYLNIEPLKPEYELVCA